MFRKSKRSASRSRRVSSSIGRREMADRRRLVFETLEDKRMLSTTLYWDPTHTFSTGGGGSGTWDTTTANWYPGSGNSDVTWSAGDSALFAGNHSGTITISGTISAAAADFFTGPYTVVGTSGNSLSAPSILVSPDYSVSIGATLTGSSGLSFYGGGSSQQGIFSLTGTNTYTGMTTISAGTLQLGNSAALGSSTTVSAASGGTLDFDGQAIGSGVPLNNFAGIIVNSSSTTASFAGTINATTSASFSVAGANNLTLSGVIGGSGSLTDSDSGTLTLSGQNNYSGATAIQNGILAIGANNALPVGTSVTLGSGSIGGILRLGDATTGYNQTLAGLYTSGTGGDTANHVWGGSSTTNSTLKLNISGSDTYAGGLGGGAGAYKLNFALEKSGTGTLVLAASGNGSSFVNYLGGTTIDSGTLQIGDGGADGLLPAGSLGTDAIANNGTLSFDRSDTFTLYTAMTISGSGNVIQAGSGTLSIYSANTYTGSTTISAGTLQVGNSAALGSSTSVSSASGGILDLDGQAIGSGVKLNNFAGTIVNSSSTAASFAGAINATTSASFAVAGANNITLSGAIGGSGSLTVWDTGKLTLSGTNTFTGGTVIGAGTLNINTDAALGTAPSPAATNITFSGNGTLQFAAGFPLSSNRKTVINSGDTGTLGTLGNSVSYAGAISGLAAR